MVIVIFEVQHWLEAEAELLAECNLMRGVSTP